VAKELQAKDVKLIQYLNEAYGKEKQLETALTAHIQMTTRAPYKKRLQQHLKETKEHGRQVSRRIKALGGKPETVELPGPEAVSEAASAVQNVANRAAALAQAPLHVLRGTGEQEKLLKNAKTEFQNEAEEIATYTAIETLAALVGDKETAKVAKAIRREEERMRDYLGKLIPQLTKSVATEEIPASERRAGGTGRRRSTSRRTSTSRASSRSATSRSTSRPSGSRSTKRSGSGSSRATKRTTSGSSRATKRSTGARAGSSRSSRSSGRKS
jgi:ferritin-like metal-binding protein YciE